MKRRNFLEGLGKLGALAILHPFQKFEDKSTEINDPDFYIQEALEALQKSEYLKSSFLVGGFYFSDNYFDKLSKKDKEILLLNEKILLAIKANLTESKRNDYHEFLRSTFQTKDGPEKSKPLADFQIGGGLDRSHSDAIDLYLGANYSNKDHTVFSIKPGLIVSAENGWEINEPLNTVSYLGGNVTIIFDPNDNSFYRYAHLNHSGKKVGESVSAGEPIGIIGQTGYNASKNNPSDIHLHLERNYFDTNTKKQVATPVKDLLNLLEN